MTRGVNRPPSRGEDGFAHQASFLGGVDHCQVDACLPPHARDERVAVGRFAHGAGRHRAILRDLVALEKTAELNEGIHGSRGGARIQAPLIEYAVAQPHRPARAGQFAKLGG